MRIIIVIFSLFSPLVFAIDYVRMEVVINDVQKSKLQNIKKIERFFNLNNGGFSIYSLDDVEHFERSLSKGLSGDPVEAKKQADKFFKESDKNKLQQQATRAYKAKMLTLKYRLKKYPAIIFDGKYVIYGEFDLNKALEYYLKVGGLYE